MAEQQPEISPIAADAPLCFACHPQVACFNECCRELDLALSPYDVLRLKKALGMRSGEFLKQYVLVSREEGQAFPLCHLSMVDDGRASCVFVSSDGCRVYADRPGSCRAYPLGRGVSLQEDGSAKEQLVLVREAHCQGFAEDCTRTATAFLDSQELIEYNRFNDALLRLYQHPRVQDKSFQPTDQQLNRYMLALYDLDRFRQLINSGTIILPFPLSKQQQAALVDNDEELLLLAIDWLYRDFFSD
ncbi:MAG: YkgJ family cysteine cluster protein [Desulfobulbaceae bacterium]|nr:YkgJ family cysteine cluster protein [Desulfobulbaceae bacterium]